VSYDPLPLRKYSVQTLPASGMVSVQAHCTVAEALIVMANCAQATGQTVEQIAARCAHGRSGSTECLSRSVPSAVAAEHQYEVHCDSGAASRVFLEKEDNPMATCLNCGATRSDRHR